MAKRLGQVTGSRVKLSRVGMTRIFLVIFFFLIKGTCICYLKSHATNYLDIKCITLNELSYINIYLIILKSYKS